MPGRQVGGVEVRERGDRRRATRRVRRARRPTTAVGELEVLGRRLQQVGGDLPAPSPRTCVGGLDGRAARRSTALRLPPVPGPNGVAVGVALDRRRRRRCRRRALGHDLRHGRLEALAVAGRCSSSTLTWPLGSMRTMAASVPCRRTPCPRLDVQAAARCPSSRPSARAPRPARRGTRRSRAARAACSSVSIGLTESYTMPGRASCRAARRRWMHVAAAELQRVDADPPGGDVHHLLARDVSIIHGPR